MSEVALERKKKQIYEAQKRLLHHSIEDGEYNLFNGVHAGRCWRDA